MPPVILALRQYPQGGATTIQHQPTNPLSLDGRGIKGEGDSKTVPPHRHSRAGGKPQGGCVVAVIADLIRNPEGRQGDAGEQDNTNHRHLSHGRPSMAAHVTDCTRNT